MMLPNELVWVMEKLGFEWPDIDEGEARRGGVLVRNLGSDLEDAIQSIDGRMNGDVSAAMRGQAGPATLGAWNTNRSQNLQKLVDLMPPAAVDVAVEQLLNQLLPMAIEPMSEQLPAVIDAILDAPMVEAGAGDSDEFFADLQALEDAQAALKQHGADIQTVTSTFFAEFSALDFGGDD